MNQNVLFKKRKNNDEKEDDEINVIQGGGGGGEAGGGGGAGSGENIGKKKKQISFEKPILLDDKGKKINVSGFRIVDGITETPEATVIYDAATLLPDGGVYGRVYSLCQDDDMGVQLVHKYNKLHVIIGNYRSPLLGGVPKPTASESWMTKRGVADLKLEHLETLSNLTSVLKEEAEFLYDIQPSTGVNNSNKRNN